MRHDVAEGVEQRLVIAGCGDVQRALVRVGEAAGQGRGGGADGGVAFFNLLALLLLGGLEAVGAGNMLDVTRIGLLLRCERRLAGEALRGSRLMQPGIDADALVEHKELAVVMRAAAFLEVLQDAALKLPDVLKALALHEGRGFLAADAAGAEGDDLRLFHFRRQLRHRIREIAKRVDARDDGAFEGAELHLVVIPRVVENDGAAFIEPLLQDFRLQTRGGVFRRFDAFHAEGDDLLFDAHQHAPKRLLRALAVFGFQAFEPGNAAQFCNERIHVLAKAGDEHVDAFGAEQDRAFQPALLAQIQQTLAQVLQAGERGELIAGDVGDRGGGWHGGGQKAPNPRLRDCKEMGADRRRDGPLPRAQKRGRSKAAPRGWDGLEG